MEVLQIAGELERAVALYRRLKSDRVLEIGCWDGGTLREWLAEGPSLVVAVSLEHRQPEAYPGWTKPGTKVVVGTGDSTSPEMVAAIQKHAPYDWAFIDGEHHYDYVKADADTVMPLMNPGGAVLFHDITPAFNSHDYGPRRVWEELGATYKTEAFDVPERFPWSAGIGVVYV